MNAHLLKVWGSCTYRLMRLGDESDYDWMLAYARARQRDEARARFIPPGIYR
jgi:hypothetical protein